MKSRLVTIGILALTVPTHVLMAEDQENPTPTKIHDSMQILAELEPEIIKHFHVDVLPLEAATAVWADADAKTGVERRLFEGTTVYFPPGTNIKEEPEGSCALDQWLVMLMTEKETASEIMDGYADAVISCLKLYHQAVGDRALAWGIASDDAGIDILNPVQISAANMEPERLKSEFGDKIVFWGGGCDTQHVLPLDTPEQVREHVRHNMEVFSKDSGFVFTQVHDIQQNVPPENVKAMFQAAYEWR